MNAAPLPAASALPAADQPPSLLSPFTPGNGPKRHRPRALYVALWSATLVVTAVMLWAPLPPAALGGLAFLALLLYMLVGIPIGLAMILSSVFCIAGVTQWRLAELTLATQIFESTATWTFSIIPMFVMMGIALWISGASEKAYGTARLWLGNMPGGLAVASNFAGAGMAASSGSSVGIVMSLSKIGMPEMLRSGYSPALAAGSVTVTGTLGQVLPPNVLLVIYAGLVEVSVGQQLLAAIVPGTLLAIAFGVVIVGWAIARPTDAPKVDLTGVTWGMRFKSLLGLLPIVIVMLVVLGGMFAGLYSAIEAAAVGAVVAVVVGLVVRGKEFRGRRGWLKFLFRTVQESIGAIAGLFLILVGSFLMTSAIARTGLAQAVSGWITDANLSRLGLLLVLMLFYLLLGMFLESLPMIILTVPILAAPLAAANIDLIWFGVFLIVMCEVGMVFPPIGLLVFIVHRIVQDPKTNLGIHISLGDMYRGVMPFVVVIFVLLIAFSIWPDIVLWLPSISSIKG